MYRLEKGTQGEQLSSGEGSWGGGCAGGGGGEVDVYSGGANGGD